MKILITGTTGMLGSYLVKHLQKKYKIFSTGRSKKFKTSHNNYLSFDLKLDDYDQLYNWSKPNIVIHCAALTDVDYCEKNHEETFFVNIESISKIIKKFQSSKIIYISTDAVFDDLNQLHKEEDKVNPLNIYGKSKLSAENILVKNSNNFTIIRTTPIGFNFSQPNFLTWIINSLELDKKIGLFTDVYFTPIDVWNLVKHVENVIDKDFSGIWHISGLDRISKYEFGLEICNTLKYNKNLIKKNSIDEVNLFSKRSKNQSLDCSKYMKVSKLKLPNTFEIINNIKYHYIKK